MGSKMLSKMQALSLLLLLPAIAAASCAPSSWIFATDNSVGVQITSDGAVQVSIAPTVAGSSERSNYSLGTANGRSLQTALLPSSPLGPSTCTTSGAGVVTSTTAGISLAQAWACTAPHPENGTMINLTTTVTDLYSAGSEAVDITTTIHVDRADVPFTAGLGMALTPSGVSAFWTPWAKGCVQNAGSRPGMCFAPSEHWSEPFTPEPLDNHTLASYRYGAPSAGDNDTFALPIVTLLDPTKDAGLSLALSPEDPQLELHLRVQHGGSAFVRDLHRLGGGRDVVLHAHLVGSAACIRPGLGFLTRQFREYFEPWVSNAADFEGTASYSWYQGDYNVSRAKSLGFKTNWDLSGTWMPYDGLFLPYQEQWENLGPINGGLTQYNVTFDMINTYYKKIQESGFHSLSYFDIGNWGVSINTRYRGPNTTCGLRPGGLPAPCPDPNGSNEFLRDHLWDGLLHHYWSQYRGKNMIHKDDWVGTTLMDTMEPCFEDLIVEQLQRHIDKLPNFEGIAIDRLDYSEYFNYGEHFGQDDNTSWIPVNGSGRSAGISNYSTWTWGPARALRLSYRHTYERLHEVLHAPAIAERAQGAEQVAVDGAVGKNYMMLQNCNWLCRLDEMKSFDGSFSEGAALNAVAWTGLRNPTILWTYSLEADPAVLDTFFQQHLLMNVYPMAPMPKNDHSINPGSPVVDQGYMDYAPMFDAMHGARWLLSAHAATLSTGTNASVNIFSLPAKAGGKGTELLIPVMLASATQTTVALTLNLGPAALKALDHVGPVSSVTLSALLPGNGATPKTIGAATAGEHGEWKADVPLIRGCSMVTALLM